MSAYHFKYFQNIQFKNHGIAPTPPDLPTLKAYPTPGVGGRFEIFSLKWRERMNLKVPGAILPLGCAILSTRAITVRGGWYNPPLGELGLKRYLSRQLFVMLVVAASYSSCGVRFMHQLCPWNSNNIESWANKWGLWKNLVCWAREQVL